MNKICYYIIISLLTLMSCKKPNIEKTTETDVVMLSETINTIKQEQSYHKKKVFDSDPIKRDTTINNYSVSYLIQNNKDVIATYPIIDGKGLDTVYYSGSEVLLSIEYQSDKILQKKINRDFFQSYIPKEEIEKYSIYYFGLDKVDNNERLVFNISVCVPETDICYWFELFVSNKGNIEIKDVSLNEDMYED